MECPPAVSNAGGNTRVLTTHEHVPLGSRCGQHVTAVTRLS